MSGPAEPYDLYLLLGKTGKQWLSQKTLSSSGLLQYYYISAVSVKL